MKDNAVKLKGDEFFPVPGFPLSVVPVNAEVALLGNYTNYTCVDHYHDYCEFVLITNGSAIQNIAGSDYPVKKGDLFLIYGNTTHFFHDLKSLQLFNLLFHPVTLPLPWAFFRKTKGHNMVFLVEPHTRNKQKFKNHLSLNNAQLHELSHQFTKLYELLHTEDDYMELAALSLLTEIFISISKFSESAGRKGNDPPPKINEIITLLEKNYRTPHTLETLSKLVHMSPRNFSRQFHIAAGISPIEYLLRARLRNAEAMLRSDKSPIVEVAVKCGFHDSNYFSKMFQCHFGISPRDYRKLHVHSLHGTESRPLAKSLQKKKKPLSI